jgi:hypothetical protein
MGVWDLVFLDNEVKKNLQLSLDWEFDEEQRAKFGQLAIEATGHLERHRANFGKTKN